MKKDHDFSRGECGMFYHPDSELSILIYLEPDVAKVFRRSAMVNQALRSLLRISSTTRLLTGEGRFLCCSGIREVPIVKASASC